MAHTQIVVPASAFKADSPVHRLFPGASAYAIGWGDARAFPGDLTPGDAISALAWPTSSVLHVEARPSVRASAGNADERAVSLALSRGGLDTLARQIEAAFALDAQGAPIVTGPGKSGPHSVFAAGTANYHLLRTCNAWTAARLKEAGAPVLAPGLHLLPWTLTGELALRAAPGCAEAS